MTTKVTVQNDGASEHSVSVKMLGNPETWLTPGTAQEFWIHDGAGLTVAEVPLPHDASGQPTDTPSDTT